MGTITMSSQPEPTPAGGSNATWGAVIFVTVRPSSTTATTE
jgi:hypothetical protein